MHHYCKYMNNCLVVSYILRTFAPDLRRIQSKLLVAFCDVDDLYIASEYMFWGPAPLEVAYQKGVCTLAICITAELKQNIIL